MISYPHLKHAWTGASLQCIKVLDDTVSEYFMNTNQNEIDRGLNLEIFMVLWKFESMWQIFSDAHCFAQNNKLFAY